MKAKKIMDYRIFYDHCETESQRKHYEKKIMEFIRKGYVPIGGVTMGIQKDFTEVCIQTLIKYED